MYKGFFALLFFVAFFINSCSRETEDSYRIGENIDLNQILSESIKSDLKMAMNDGFNNLIVSVLDTRECHSCSLIRVDIWKSYKQTLSELKTKNILVISKTAEDIIKSNPVGPGFPLIYDNKNDFLSETGNIKDPWMATFVINKNLDILWVGSPLGDKESFEKFCNILKANN